MRIKLDERYLNSIKQKLITRFNLSQEIIDTLNRNSSALYVENLKETSNAMMMSRNGEIAIDKQFIVFDNNGNIIGFNQNYYKLVESQLGHELLHASSKSNGYSGIYKMSDDNNRGLNEGITQMFTEDTFGYVVSRFSDRYTDFKKIAKIMRLCVGDEPFRSSYFSHTDKLKESCFNLAGDINFYDEFNRALTDLYYLKQNTVIKNKEQLNIVKKIYEQRMRICYTNLIVNMVIPRMKKFKSDIEARNFINSLLRVVADDKEITREIIDMLKDKIKLDDKELVEEKKKIQLFEKKQKEKTKVFNLLNQNKLSSSQFAIDSEGRIFYINDSNIQVVIEEDEELYTHIYGILFKEVYGKNIDMDRYVDNLQNNNKLSLPTDISPKMKRIFFSGLKMKAREKGIEILNSYKEVNNNVINLSFVSKNVEFKDLIKYIENFELKPKKEESFNGEYIVVNKITNKQVENDEICTNVKFAYLWLSTHQHQVDDEHIPGITDAFSAENEVLYNELLEKMSINIRNNGNINPEELYAFAENHSNSRMEKIARTIINNPLSYEWIYSFVKQKNGRIPLQTEREKSYMEQQIGTYDEGMMRMEVDDIVSHRRR